MDGFSETSSSPTAEAGETRWVLVCLGLLLLGLWSSLVSFPGAWNDARTHGYPILVFCLWMIATDRKQFVPSRDVEWPVALCSGLVSMVWLLAVIIGVRVVHQAAVPILLVLWVTAVYGERGWRLSLPIALVFSLAVPFWEVLVGPLQWMTVQTNSALISLFGLGANVDGQRIHFPFGTIEVAESCAGLSYFMSALTIALVYSRLFLRTGEGTLVATALALGLAVVSNWMRVFGLVLVGYWSQMKSPLMAEHATYGWVIFAIVISGFFLLSSRIERWEAQRVTRLDVWAHRFRERMSTAGTTVSRTSVWSITVVSLLGPLLFFGVSILPARVDAAADTTGVVTSGWSALTQHPVASTNPAGSSDWKPGYSGFSEYRQRRFARNDYEVQLDHLIFAEQHQGAELIGGGNVIAEQMLSERPVGPLDDNLRTVREAIVRTPAGARLVWYWYRVGGSETSSPAKAKLLELVAFFTRKRAAELIAVSAPCGKQSCSIASRALYLFLTGKELSVQ